MKLKFLPFFWLLVGLMVTTQLSAQDKIGYTNFQMVLAYMPEAKTMTASLTSYEKTLVDQLKVKEASYESYFKSVMQKMERGLLTAAQQEQESAKLGKMENEIALAYEEVERKVEQRKDQLLAPILSKLEKAIKEVARENGYTYIFNSVDSGGASLLLYGPEDRDITKKVLIKLGINTGN